MNQLTDSSQAEQMARALEQSQAQIHALQQRLTAMEERQHYLAETLWATARALNMSLERGELLNLILKQLAHVVAYDSATVRLIVGDEWESVATCGRYAGDHHAHLQVQQLPHMVAVLEEGKARLIRDTRQDPHWITLPGSEYIGCWLGVPLIAHGRMLGVLNLNKVEPNYYADYEVTLALAFADYAAVAIENARLMAEKEALYAEVRAHATELEERVAARTQQLAAANERLQELDRLKTKFIADVSHELRTPISTQLLYLNLLEKGNPAKHPHYFQILKQETERLGGLIEDVLNVSRLELAQTIGRRHRIIDLNLLVEQAIHPFHNRAQVAGLALIFEPLPERAAVMGAEEQLILLISNLVNNAINYTLQGSVRVTLRHHVAQQEIELEVADTGIGIPQDEMPHLFERFYRGRQVGQLGIPGTGLGLGVAHEIVQMHNGRLTVTSIEGQGSSFQIWLPAIAG